MNNSIKTVIFVSVALLCALVVFLNLPKSDVQREADPAGQLLCPKFAEPTAITTLQITRCNEETGDVVPFEVALVDDKWLILSHEKYPADATEHLAEVATALCGLKILGLASEKPGSQELYGVFDPTDKNFKPGITGVGTRVVLKDAKNGTLADIIIGKQDPDRPNIRYVRRTGQERIFSVDLQAEEFSTKFDDWIEKDLLKMNVLDIRDIFIEDYNIDVLQGVQTPHGKLAIHYDVASEENKWNLLENLVYDRGEKQWVPRPLQPHEMLDTEKMEQMKSALEDLKIVDVVRKPTGLSADLVAEKTLLQDQEAIASLALHGFYMAEINGDKGIYSNEGEIGILLNDGVEYILRFGSIALNSKAAANSDSKKTDEKEDAANEDTDASGLNRYLLVTTRFNPVAIERPVLEPLPELPAEVPAEKPTEKPGDGASEKKEDVPSKEAETKIGDVKKVEDEKKAEGEKKTPLEQIKAERERIERRNQWKKDEYEKKMADGQKRVKELNARFADWYYVISESVFKKLHLTQKELIQVKQPEPIDEMPSESGPVPPFSPGALDKLKEGLGTP